jgi:hypothetical protein
LGQFPGVQPGQQVFVSGNPSLGGLQEVAQDSRSLALGAGEAPRTKTIL